MKTSKKRIKLKKKTWFILIFIILIIVIVLVHKPSKPVDDKPKNNMEKITDLKEKLDYYNPDYKERYLSYEQTHKSLSHEQIVKDVNMNLDKTKYVDTIPAKNLNTEKVLVNKYYYLDENYVPNNLENISLMYALSNMRLVHEAKVAFEEMASAAKKENLNIIALSTYRSYSYQVNLYNRYIQKDGQEKVDTYSGRPGFSEHQTGLAVDVYNKEEDYTNFENTKEFEWMTNHAHEYGFILRFPKDKVNETGYRYESWHYRYVGIEIATYIHENNISLEEYYATKIKDW